MNSAASVLDAPVLRSIGWVLAQFVWQALLLGTLLRVSLRFARRDLARVRAAWLQGLLLAFVLCPGLSVLRAVVTDRPAPIPEVTAPVLSASPVPVPDSSPAGANVARDLGVVRPPSVHAWRGAVPAYLRDHAPRGLSGAAVLWVLGAVAFGARTLGAAVLLRRLTRRGSPPDPRWVSTLRSARTHTGIRDAVVLRQSGDVTVPMVAGGLPPMVLVPAPSACGSDHEAELILAHELVHLERRDHRWNLLQAVVEAIFFFHPAVWWVSRRLRQEREQACDDRVLELYGDPRGYAAALTGLEERSLRGPRLVLAVAEGPLLGRIRRLLSPGHGRVAPGPGRRVALVLGAMGLGVLVLGTWLTPVPAAPSPTPRSYAEWLAQVNAALDRGDAVAAIETYGREPRRELRYSAAGLRLYERMTDLLHRRYEEVFVPPENVEDLVPNVWWARIPPRHRFVVAPVRYEKVARFQTPETPDSAHVYVQIGGGHCALRVDLDLDGTPELTFDGREARAQAGTLLSDRARDGRRQQWLYAPQGEDPRQQAAVLLWRDGSYLVLLVDVDGDGDGEFNGSYWLESAGG